MDSYAYGCYFPTTTLFVDDRKNFLENLTLNLDENLSYKTFINPEKAIEFLEQTYHLDTSFQKWLTHLETYIKDFNNPDSNDGIQLNISLLLDGVLYSPDRFREISVSVVDYAMPKMNGIEFCRSLNKLPTKKLMMTGEASDAIAVEAFNEGIIDRFIRKQSPDFYGELHKTIQTLQKKYFQYISNPLTKLLNNCEYCWVKEPNFHLLFHKIIKSNKIIEYYLIDPYGSFLMLDEIGNIYFLVTKGEKTLKDFYFIAEDNDAPQDILKALKEKNHILFFFTEKDLKEPVAKWNRYLHPAQVLEGEKQSYYYALISGTSIYNINREKIVSYKDYLRLL